MSDTRAARLADTIAVRRYLESLAEPRAPQPNHVRLLSALEDVEQALVSAEGVVRLHLVQRRLDLRARLEGTTPDRPALEEAFIAAAPRFAAARGITLAAWRELGVPYDVLAHAGFARPRRSTRLVQSKTPPRRKAGPLARTS